MLVWIFKRQQYYLYCLYLTPNLYFFRQERLAAVAEMKKQKRRQKKIGGRQQQTAGEALINKRML